MAHKFVLGVYRKRKMREWYGKIACNLLIFGAKGDLSRRKLVPSIYRLEKMGLIHPETRIICIGRMSRKTGGNLLGCEMIRRSLEEFSGEWVDRSSWLRLCQKMDFYDLDVDETENFLALRDKLNPRCGRTVSYLATPSAKFGSICRGLSRSGLNNDLSCVVLEKPIGTDAASSRLINDQVSEHFREDQIFRIDHYLGKKMIMDLPAMRFANSLLSSAWSRKTIDHVQITVAEDIGVEGRLDYFDRTGQIRDMVQSHLLQILSMVAMTSPVDFTTDRIREEKVKILRSLKVIDSERIDSDTVLGQYTSGWICGVKVPGYLEEVGSGAKSRTETFVSIRVEIDDPSWYGVPFYLRTGKRLARRYSEVVVFFKQPVPNPLSCPSLVEKLTIHLQPNEGVSVQIPGLTCGVQKSCRQEDLVIPVIEDKERSAGAYERLLLEIMKGDRSLFVQRDEIDAAWRWVDSIIGAWDERGSSPEPYRAGTGGPNASDLMIWRDGRFWNPSPSG